MNATTGVFTFAPAVEQVGNITLTFMVSDGGLTDSETITITVPAPSGVTTLRGTVLTTDSAPLENVRLVVGTATSVETFSQADGTFFASAVPSGTQRLLIDGSTADAALGTFATVPETISLIEGADNVLEPPIVLLPLDVASADPITSTETSVVTSSPIVSEGETFSPVTLTVSPGTATLEETGELFEGNVSISAIPDPTLGPRPLPDDLVLSVYIAIQPFGVAYDPPAPISFPNVENFPPGSIVDIFGLNHDTGVFEKVGEGRVSADGSVVNSLGGVVRNNSWHGFVPQPPDSQQAETSTTNPNQAPDKAAQCPCGSEFNLESGDFSEDHTLASYRSYGVSRALRLVYHSTSAEPRPIIAVDSTIGNLTPPPVTMSNTLQIGGVDQGFELFAEPSLVQDPIFAQFATTRSSVQFDATLFTTGAYPYGFTVNCNFPISRRSATVEGTLIIQNESQSPFGAGWGIDGLRRLYADPEGTVLVTSGNGAAQIFTGTAGPGSTVFTPPPGDFSTLSFSPTDGTHSLGLKDGTKINFDPQGRQTSVVDLNGNTTSYAYDTSGRLSQVTDPAGLVTTLAYGGNGRIASVTDPAGRITLFAHDSDGNLVQITDPDGSVRAFGYQTGTHLLASQTDKRGFETQYAYDFAGRFASTRQANGDTMALRPSQIQTLIDPASGQGSATDPAPPPPVASDLESLLTNGRGNVTMAETDTFGAITEQVDPLGRVTTLVRDVHSNPTPAKRCRHGAHL